MRLWTAILIALPVSGCIINGGDDELVSIPTDVIANCGGGVSISRRSALKLDLNAGIGLSLGRRSTLRAAFLEGFPRSSISSRVRAYTQYVACVTNQTAREIALSNILEKRITFLSYMRRQGLSERSIASVASLYDEQYEATQIGDVAEANTRLAKIAVTFFDEIQSNGVVLAALEPMPMPAPPYRGPPGTPPPPEPTPEQIRQQRLENAWRELEIAAERNTEPVSADIEPQRMCERAVDYSACRQARQND